jgi:hypothetical protein
MPHNGSDLACRAIHFPPVGTRQKRDEPAIDARSVGYEVDRDYEDKEELNNSAKRNSQNRKKLL